MDRRDFIQTSGAGMLGMAMASRWMPSLRAGERRPPVNPVVLRSAELEVVLDREEGLPVEYRVLAGGEELAGEVEGNPVGVRVCRRESWSFEEVKAKAGRVEESGDGVAFSFDVSVNHRSAVTFTLRYRLDRATLFVTLEDIREHPGFELIEVALPQLVTVREDQEGAWLAHGDDGGNLALLAGARPGSLPVNRFWGKVLASLPVVMVGTRKAVCVQEVTAFMDATELTVRGESGRLRASLGTIQRHRVNGSRSYDMNAGPGAPRIFGNRNTPNLLIGQTPACRLDFLGQSADGRAPDWLDAAKLVRRRMPEIPTHYYDDKFVYDLMCDLPKLPAARTPFSRVGKIVEQVAALTDRCPQVVHLWGWQYHGKDTGYPAVAEVDTRDGGYDAMMRLMEDARQHNCVVTLSDNYDDAYKSSPAWNPAYIARRPDGQLWKSRAWTGEASYVQGMAKYMAGPGAERVQYTCERYRLRETTHIDVLSYYAIRNDWDPDHPASGVKNLAARYEVVDLFRRHGVDVSSEFMRYAFIGKISSFMNGMAGGRCPFGGQPIPLMATIYRKSAVWGQSGKGDNLDRILKMLFYNGRASLFFGDDLNVEQAGDYYYLMLVPWFQLHHRDVESFVREGAKTTLQLEGGATVGIDWDSRTYSVKIGGVVVARNDVTTCPLGDDRIALYSTRAMELSVPLPAGWNPAQTGAMVPGTGVATEVESPAVNGEVRIRVAARQPVMLYRDKTRMRTRINA